MKSNRTNSSASRRMAIFAGATIASFCSLASLFTSVVTAEEAESEVVQVESTSFVIVRQAFKSGERIEWTAYELGSPFSFTPQSTKNYTEDPRFGTMKKAIEALGNVKRNGDPKLVAVPVTGSAVTSGDLVGEMGLLFVVNGDSCMGYSTTEDLNLKSIRKLSWTTFE